MSLLVRGPGDENHHPLGGGRVSTVPCDDRIGVKVCIYIKCMCTFAVLDY